jgi:2-polyprenyl-6-methoxyphenol hydroxylase-like FAD-dependent oxidoreductase
MTAPVDTECCIVGGGPAGMMAGYLFARAGVKTLVLEKHGDFLRDFRGDTVHPSTLEIMYELGLAEGLLKRPHEKIERLGGNFGDKHLRIGDFTGIKAHYPFVALMPQWDFLDFLADEAKKLPSFSLSMNTEATGLIEENGRVAGVHAKGPEGEIEITAKLTIGADGRHSTVRDASGLKVVDIGAPIDVFWFRVDRDPEQGEDVLFNAAAGRIVVTIDRGDYWQCAYVIAKNEAPKIRAAGLDAFRRSVVDAVPWLAGHIDQIASWDDVKLLTVTVDRLEKWSRPGLVMIGDSAHAMSPVGGIGINLAIQDAVASANLLAGRLAADTLTDADLERVRQRRLWPTRVVQFVQVQAHRLILTPLLKDKEQVPKPPLLIRIVSAIPWLQRRFASWVGLGVRPEHVHSPRAD